MKLQMEVEVCKNLYHLQTTFTWNVASTNERQGLIVELWFVETLFLKDY